MALAAPSSTLTGQTIADSYDQVLFLDSAAGVTEATLKIVSGTAGKTALSISDEHVLVKGVDTNNAAGFEVQQTDGTSILKVAAGTPSVLVSGSGVKLYFNDAGGEYISGDGTDLTIAAGTALNITADVIDLSDATKDVTLNAAVDALNFDSNTLSIDASNNRVGIGTAAPDSHLHIYGTGAKLKLEAVADGDAQIDFEQAGTRRHIMGYDHSVLAFKIARDFDNDDFCVDNSGNVGIGTASVDTLLHLESSTSGGNCRLKLEDTNADDNPPTLIFVKDSASPAVNDYLGAMYFHGDDNQPAQHTYAAITVQSSNITNDSEEGLMNLMTSVGGTLSNVLTIKGGDVGIGTTSPSYKLEVEESANSAFALWVANTAASGTVYNIYSALGYSPDNQSCRFFQCADTTNDKLIIFDDGDVQNHDNTYGAISDERIKQDIRDANSQWDDIKAIKVRNFKRKDDIFQYGDDAWEQIGVVAQEVEEVSPKLINQHPPSEFELEHCGFGDYVEAVLYEAGDDELREAVEAQDAVYETVVVQEAVEEVLWSEEDELPEGVEAGDVKTEAQEEETEEQLVSEAVQAVEAISIGDVKEEAKWVVKQDDDGKDMQVKSMKYSILYMKAVKALQEAMERIEGLESKVEALENA